MVVFCFCKQKTAYEMRISDWSSDVCSSDLRIIKKMAAAGDLPDDPRAEEALATGLTILRTSESEERKLKAAGLLLTWLKPKPTAKVEHTIKTAEDLLDEMAEDDDEN